jgi:hypothetical protein
MAPDPAPQPDPLAHHARLSAALTGTTDSRLALAALCEAVRELAGCDRVQVWRGDLRQMTMGVLIAVGYDEDEATRLGGLSVPMTDMPLAPDFLERKYLTVTHARRAPGSEALLFDAFRIEAAAYLLLERGDRILGAMQLSWCTTPTPAFPAPETVALIARYAGLAVDIHARTDETMQMAATLSETAMLLSQIHEPGELLQQMARKITEAIGCEWGTVHLLAEQEGVYRYVAGAGPTALLARFAPLEAPRTRVEESLNAAAEGFVEMRRDSSRRT